MDQNRKLEFELFLQRIKRLNRAFWIWCFFKLFELFFFNWPFSTSPQASSLWIGIAAKLGLFYLIVLASIRWIQARSDRSSLEVGIFWIGLSVVFQIVFSDSFLAAKIATNLAIFLEIFVQGTAPILMYRLRKTKIFKFDFLYAVSFLPVFILVFSDRICSVDRVYLILLMVLSFLSWFFFSFAARRAVLVFCYFIGFL